MTEAENDALNIFNRMTEVSEAPMSTEMIEGALGGDSVIVFAVADVAKKIEKGSKNMREAEVDALNILLKATEAAEAAMAKDMR